MTDSMLSWSSTDSHATSITSHSHSHSHTQQPLSPFQPPPIPSSKPTKAVRRSMASNKENRGDESNRPVIARHSVSVSPVRSARHSTTAAYSGVMPLTPSRPSQSLALASPVNHLHSCPVKAKSLAASQNENVRVYVRVRDTGTDDQSCLSLDTASNNVSVTRTKDGSDRNSDFTYDAVFGPSTDTASVYASTASAMIEPLVNGFNCSILAYGQTSSGKTYTMMGNLSERASIRNGVIPKCLEGIFARLTSEGESDSVSYAVALSFMEIYNDKVYDMLAPHSLSASEGLKVREEKDGTVVVPQLTRNIISTSAEACQLIEQGNNNRSVAATAHNIVSSRSHAIIQIIVEKKIGQSIISSRLDLVDLAGSEKYDSATHGADAKKRAEMSNINKSLDSLTNVMMALTSKATYVPYRNSNLTWILKDSLGGQSKCAIIACINPQLSQASETLNTLKYAARAKLIKNEVKKSTITNSDSASVTQLHAEIERQKRLHALRMTSVANTLERFADMAERENQLDDCEIVDSASDGEASDYSGSDSDGDEEDVTAQLDFTNMDESPALGVTHQTEATIVSCLASARPISLSRRTSSVSTRLSVRFSESGDSNSSSSASNNDTITDITFDPSDDSFIVADTCPRTHTNISKPRRFLFKRLSAKLVEKAKRESTNVPRRRYRFSVCEDLKSLDGSDSTDRDGGGTNTPVKSSVRLSSQLLSPNSSKTLHLIDVNMGRLCEAFRQKETMRRQSMLTIVQQCVAVEAELNEEIEKKEAISLEKEIENSQLQSAIEAVKSEWKREASTASEQRARILSLQSELAASQSSIADRESQLQSSASQLSELNAVLLALRSELASVETELETTNHVIDEMGSERETQSQEIEELKKKHLSLEAHVESFVRDKEKLLVIVKRNSVELSSARQERQSLAAQIQSLQSMIDSHLATITEREAAIAALQARLASNDREWKECAMQLAEANSRLMALQEVLEQRNAEMQSLIAEHEARQQQAAQNLTASHTEVAVQSKAIEALNSQVSELMEAQKTLKSELAQQESGFGALLGEAHQSLAARDAQLSDCVDTIAALQSALAERKHSIRALESQAFEATTVQSQLRQRITGLEQDVEEQQWAIDALEMARDSDGNESAEQGQQIMALNQSLTVLTEAVQSLQSSLAQAQNASLDYEQEIQSLRSQLSTKTSENNVKTQALHSLQQSLQSVQLECQTQQSEAGKLRAELHALASDKAALASENESRWSLITTLLSEKSINEKNHAKLKSLYESALKQSNDSARESRADRAAVAEWKSLAEQHVSTEAAWQQEIEGLTNANMELKTVVGEQARVIKQQASLQRDHDTQLQSLQQQLSAETKVRFSLLLEMRALQAQLASAESESDRRSQSLMCEMVELQDTVSAVTNYTMADAEAVTIQREQQQARQQALEQEIAALHAALRQSQASQAQQQSAMAASESSRESLQSQLMDLGCSVGGITHDQFDLAPIDTPTTVSQRDGDSEGLMTEVSDLQSSLTSLAVERGNYAELVALLQHSNSELDAHLQSLLAEHSKEKANYEARIRLLDEELSALSQRVPKIRQLHNKHLRSSDQQSSAVIARLEARVRELESLLIRAQSVHDAIVEQATGEQSALLDTIEEKCWEAQRVENNYNTLLQSARDDIQHERTLRQVAEQREQEAQQALFNTIKQHAFGPVSVPLAEPVSFKAETETQTDTSESDDQLHAAIASQALALCDSKAELEAQSSVIAKLEQQVIRLQSALSIHAMAQRRRAQQRHSRQASHGSPSNDGASNGHTLAVAARASLRRLSSRRSSVVAGAETAASSENPLALSTEDGYEVDAIVNEMLEDEAVALSTTVTLAPTAMSLAAAASEYDLLPSSKAEARDDTGGCTIIADENSANVDPPSSRPVELERNAPSHSWLCVIM